MRVVVADRAVDLAQQLDRADGIPGAAQAVDDVGEFLADRGGRRRLAVGARQHRQVGQLVRQVGQARDDLFQRRQQHGIARALQHQGMRQVVDVFRGAGEVDELGHRRDFGVGLRLFLEEILDRLDVVIGGRLDGLDALGVGHRKVVGDAVEQRDGVSGKRRHFGNRGFGRQRLQPFDLDDDAVSDQRVFAEEVAQRRGLAAVAAIEGRQGGECGQFHRVVRIRFSCYYVDCV